MRYLLRNLDSALNAMAASDKILVMKEGTNASYTQAIDVSNEFRNGAKLFVAQFRPVTVSAGSITVDEREVENGAVITLIMGNANDLQIVGGVM